MAGEVNGFLLVALGGALGSMARYGFYRAVPAPWGTLGVNIIGGFLMGLLVGVLSGRGLSADSERLFLGAGVLGGFTTFSAFSLDVVQMLERGALGEAALYGVGSTALSIGGVFLGLLLGRMLA
jgi:CrcB protein